MFHRRLAGLALLLSAAGAAAATPWAGQDAAANRVHATVQFLADDLLEGRGTGTRVTRSRRLMSPLSSKRWA